MSKRIVTIHYQLTNQEGEVIDSSRNGDAFSYLEGRKQIIPGLEEAVKTMNNGDKKEVFIPASEAYGEYNEKFVFKIPREDVPLEDIEIGAELQAAEGELEGQVFRVTELSDDLVTLDANHPLAGVDLCFDVELIETRAATQEEMDHGHAHGDGCCE
ncbi:MAG: peptidylprolyl isomerase [Deltaproteobacteria bacterium CG11_big_fil_rev_8_21_14_0_20_42_23]|nr:MAG: peptidylprolyl isomerase [Deltaproteobacteria bacterium CG11_big_fil_rev_8_21_14_0_20_42_23]PJC64007.1 MAG: peptidylprolyl isomerase [Deltaproteobacteria bacterium CG_4_9_14_0_2_um_filter_42_21]